MKDELRIKLDKLVAMAKRETIPEAVIPKWESKIIAENTTKNAKSVDMPTTDSALLKKSKEWKRFIRDGYDESIKVIADCENLSNYDKARALLFMAKIYPYDHPVADIPCTFINDVLNMIEMDNEIDYSKDCKHFRLK